jgi:hypothetical protein
MNAATRPLWPPFRVRGVVDRVSRQRKLIELPPPAALCERVDLPRKRER